MTQRGHNENAVRLASLAGDAQIALDKVARGEIDAIDGWLAYGAALNEGRSLFDGDTEFGKWMAANSLRQVGGAEVHDHERAAAMWAAANRDQFEEARAASKARTVRGFHDWWKKVEAEREKAAREAERKAKEAAAKAEAEAKRKEAEAQEKAEAEARAAAAAAETDEDREAAEATAEEAAAAKAEAEKAAEEAEAAIVPAEPEGDPETAKQRRALAKLTAEGLIDEVIGLRAENAELREKAKALGAEAKALQDKVRDLSSGDSGTVIANLNKRLKQAENEKWRQTEETGRAMKQVHALKKRVAELESMGIAL